MTQHHWKDLIVWNKAHQLVIDVYKVPCVFPESERYNLSSQIRRVVTSVPTNIVEGHDRNSTKEFLRFLYIPRGSLEETRYLLFLARDLAYIEETEYQKIENKCSEVSILMNNLIKSIKAI